MFAHANALEQNTTHLKDGELAVFIRLGSDYKNNYYEYEIPLKLTEPRNNYNRYSSADRRLVWPEENMLNVNLSVFTASRRSATRRRQLGMASYLAPYVHDGCRTSGQPDYHRGQSEPGRGKDADDRCEKQFG